MGVSFRLLITYSLAAFISYSMISDPTEAQNTVIIFVVLSPVAVSYMSDGFLSDMIDALAYLAGFIWLLLSFDSLWEHMLNFDVVGLIVSTMYIFFGGAVTQRIREDLTGHQVSNEPSAANYDSVAHLKKEWTLVAIIVGLSLLFYVYLM